MNVINSIGAVVFVVLGLVGFFFPNLIAKFVGIIPCEGRGKSEIRATYGGVFLGVGASALYFQESHVFTAVGIGWALAAVGRILGILVDKEYHKLNFGGVLFEISVAILLLWR